MFDYLQQFNKLPKDLREKVSSPSILAALSDLETQYRVDLAMLVMKVMIKELAVKDLPNHFVSEFGFLPVTAEHLTRDLKEKIFAPVAYYLDLMTEIRALDLDKDIDLIIKEAGLTLPSANLVSRFRNILSTYLRGIRNKIDTRSTLAKDVKVGGLNLSVPEIEQVLKVCASHKFKNLDQNEAPSERAAAPVSRLDEIINKTEKTMASLASEYNLKSALAEGKVNVVSTPAQTAPAPTSAQVASAKPGAKIDASHELAAPKEILDLPSPAPVQALNKPQAPAVSPIKAQVSGKNIPPVSAPIVSAPPKKVKSGILASSVAAVRSLLMGQKKTEKRSGLALPIKTAATVKPITPVVPIKHVVPEPVKTPSRPAPAPFAAPRQQMHDIRPVPRIMGPIEELQFFDLDNFRRLGKTPEEATAKIFAKIKLLERDGYDKMVAGIKAWRVSPVNRLYMRLCQEAVVHGVTLKEAVADRQRDTKEYLSQEEMDAIIALNSKLAF